jgi:hypothetical protein
MTLDPGFGAAHVAAPLRLSDVLRELETGLAPRVALGDLVSGLRDRGFAPLLILFAVPNAFLYIPGASALTGVPLMILSSQLIIGRGSVWLPRTLNDRSMDRDSFVRIVRKSVPWVERIERLARPRFWPGGTAFVDRVIGLVCFLMALLLFLPIPLGNAAPALAIIALSLALSERDGVWLILGILTAAFATAYVAAIIGGGALALIRIF